MQAAFSPPIPTPTPEPEPRRDPKENKYFHEPGTDDQLGHYDARFFHGKVTHQERTETQLDMIRAYLKFFQDEGLETWIAHGTLLGWWWNGQRLPWDWDMDVQVSDATLRRLGAHYNQSVHEYSSHNDKREYLLDINSWIWERVPGDGMNIIDARWIDKRNGLFIDITGLSEIKPDTEPGVWSCKHKHRYNVTDLYPLRETVFEGVKAMVPYAYQKHLVVEYGEKALMLREYQGYIARPLRRHWLILADIRGMRGVRSGWL
ncbi:hypothetical protein M011DRAFT_471846 [Sporormia fimetaria CBS 119925]|uniref:LicD/FKTN/FKRP nucleotidyltransferase domain-containing protein n=1 Tax=Sporormia fimetaria CBS 119925 TaxID=1340428 RepID=A0A6A6UXG2_9PLEO|nr:hypothetical protein M011DRAFT_471846 [Sporormia fimetaria CBS 119925]